MLSLSENAAQVKPKRPCPKGISDHLDVEHGLLGLVYLGF